MTDYFTYEEIRRQPETWGKTVETVQNSSDDVIRFFNDVKPDEVLFVGCGTSYYISIAGAMTFMEVTGISAKAVPASEIFLKPNAVINPKKQTLVIGSSRSGSTTEVVRALNYVKTNGLGETLAVTAYPDSELASQASLTIVLPHVQEKSVVMTSSFTNILLTHNLIAGIVADDKAFLNELKQLPEAGFSTMDHAMQVGKEVGEELNHEHYIFLGLGAYFGLACEGMLKMKEMTQVVCEAFNPLEFRHGPISVLTEKCKVVLLSQTSTTDYDVSLAKDVEKYGASTTILSEKAEPFASQSVVSLKAGFSDQSRSILYMLFLQWMAYYRTLKIGFNPDEPRNLTQVVKL